jgi:hypothetical protein
MPIILESVCDGQAERCMSNNQKHDRAAKSTPSQRSSQHVRMHAAEKHKNKANHCMAN